WTHDTTPPTGNSISINGGASYTNSTSVTLTLASTGASQMRFKNESSGTYTSYEAYATSKSWTLANSEGTNTVYVQFKDVVGNVASAVSDTIDFDTTSPTMTLTASAVADGGNHNAAVTMIFTSSEATSNFVAGDITATNASVSNFTPIISDYITGGRAYTATITPSSSAPSVVVGSNKFTDGAGNNNTTSNTYNWTHDDSASSSTATSLLEQGFETTDLGGWSQDPYDDFDWTLQKKGSTSSALTGPSKAQEGNYYSYTESSSPNYPYKTANLLSPLLNFSGFSDVELEFSYHMYGTGMGTLALEASQTGYAGPWTKVLSLSGDQGNSWRVYTIDLSAYAGQTNVMLRFSAKTGSSYTSDISIDNIKITTVK
ncbi:MAG: hypothetical protein CMK60_10385, partial [Proteobacteria bacterium]|nr:hypothetical protein [Pseudomonadota bacterium]